MHCKAFYIFKTYYEHYDCDKCGVKCRHDFVKKCMIKLDVFCKLTAFEIYNGFKSENSCNS